MKVLVLGASGLVGWNLYQEAKALGHEVVGTYRAHAIPLLIPFQSSDKDSLATLFDQVRPNAAFYCAGWSWVDGCEGDPVRAQFENAELPALAAACARERGCHFTYFSTSYVFDGSAGPYDEEAQTGPVSVYGQSKLAGEKAVLDAAAGNAIIARTMGVYGEEPQQKNFVYQVRRELSVGRAFRVPKDQFGNATYAPDLAQMAIELSVRGESGIWNLAGPEANLCRSDFARKIAESYGLPVDLIEPVETASLKQPAPRPVQGGLLIDKVLQVTSVKPRPWVKIP